MKMPRPKLSRLLAALAELAEQESRLAGLGEFEAMTGVQERIQVIQNAILATNCDRESAAAAVTTVLALRRKTCRSLQREGLRLRAEHDELVRRRGRVGAMRPVYAGMSQNGASRNLNAAA